MYPSFLKKSKNEIEFGDEKFCPSGEKNLKWKTNKIIPTQIIELFFQPIEIWFENEYEKMLINNFIINW